MIKKALSYLVTVSISLALALAAAEAMLRAYGLFDRNRGLMNCMGVPDTKYHHSLKPNSSCRMVSSKKGEYDISVRINNFGFRGADIALGRTAGVKRVLVLGDSFAFGVGADDDETIPHLMQRYLAESGSRVEVINGGFGGYSPLLHYLKLKGEYLELEPDLVVYMFDFSDIADDLRAQSHLVFDKAGKIIRCDPTYIWGRKDWWAELRMRSRLCAYIHNKVIRALVKIRALGLRAYIDAKLHGRRAKALIIAKDIAEGSTDAIERDPYLMVRGRDRLLYMNGHLARSEKYLDMIREAFASEKAPMILVIYPLGIHIGPGQWATGRLYWGFEMGKTYEDRYAFDAMEEYARSRGMPCINLLDPFLAHKDERLFFDTDGHFTPAANAIAAKAIIADPEFRKALEK